MTNKRLLIIQTTLAACLLCLLAVARTSAQTAFDCSTVTDGVSLTECNALVAIYNTNGGANWQYDNGVAGEGDVWLETTTPCSWYGVTCNVSAEITSLDLGGNGAQFGVTGVLSAEIGRLSNLTSLTLQDNAITALPAEIGNLSRLSFLLIWDNQLTTLPPEIGNLNSLSYFSVSNNQLTSIPATIGNLSSLAWLSFANNLLTQLPATLGDLAQLRTLYMMGNQLTTLPAQLTTLPNLQTFNAQNNLFSCQLIDTEPFASWDLRDTLRCRAIYLPILQR